MLNGAFIKMYKFAPKIFLEDRFDTNGSKEILRAPIRFKWQPLEGSPGKFVHTTPIRLELSLLKNYIGSTPGVHDVVYDNLSMPVNNIYCIIREYYKKNQYYEMVAPCVNDNSARKILIHTPR